MDCMSNFEIPRSSKTELVGSVCRWTEQDPLEARKTLEEHGWDFNLAVKSVLDKE